MPGPVAPLPEIRELLIAQGAREAYKCYQCGKCMAACPWYSVAPVNYAVYRYPLAVKMGTVTASEDRAEVAAEVEDIFRCLGCDACRAACPRGVDMSVILRAARRLLVDYASLPQQLKSVLTKVRTSGNPLGEPKEKRAAWAEGLRVPPFDAGMDFLYFPCCVPSYHQRAQAMAKATATILSLAHVRFGLLGERESCCGEAVRKMGAEKLFSDLANANMRAFGAAGVKRVLVTSPHCLTAFTLDYAEQRANVQALHETQLFAELIDRKRLMPRKRVGRVVTYHDPCLLGRKRRIYEEPRAVLKSIPGLQLVEMEHFTKAQSLCCGGGSGGLWLDRPPEMRVTNVRALQAARTGADTLAVACPYCLLMFEDAVKVLNLPLEVKAISELLLEAL
ncbi:MAG: (Fe-S)-binding protein [Candidatus Hadarchaeum sp.]